MPITITTDRVTNLLPVIVRVRGIGRDSDGAPVYYAEGVHVLEAYSSPRSPVDGPVFRFQFGAGLVFGTSVVQPGSVLVAHWERQRLDSRMIDRLGPDAVRVMTQQARLFLVQGLSEQEIIRRIVDYYRNNRDQGVPVVVVQERSDTWIEGEAAPSSQHRPRQYNPGEHEFESSPMSRWVHRLPGILPLPESVDPNEDSDSFTLIGSVKVRVVHTILRRENHAEVLPALRSSPHKSPLASSVHDWQLQCVFHGEEINERLVPLLRQIDRCPFLPVVNLALNAAGITEVAVEAVEINTVPNQPNTLSVNLAGRKFDTGGLGFVMPFGMHFNWPLFQVYCDFLPRFREIALPMRGRVQLWMPSDEFVRQVLSSIQEDDGSISLEMLGFEPTVPAANTPQVQGLDDFVSDLPGAMRQQKNRGFVVSLGTVMGDQLLIVPYEAVMVDKPSTLARLLRIARSGEVKGFEARRVESAPGNRLIAKRAMTVSEIDAVLKELDRGSSARKLTDSIVICWRLDAPVTSSDLNSTLQRMLQLSRVTSGSGSAGGSARGTSAPRPPSSRREYVIRPDVNMFEPLLPDDVEFVWTSISASFGNTVVSLKRDLGDPLMQYLGKSDITLMLHGITDAQGVAVLQYALNRMTALTYILRGLGFIRPVVFFMKVDNEIADMVGLEHALPVALEVQNTETPGYFGVTLSFVSMSLDGVQGRALQRLSDPLRSRDYDESYSLNVLDTMKKYDRFSTALQRYELYPDLRLPSYETVIRWCEALANLPNPSGADGLFVKQSLERHLRGVDDGLKARYYSQVSSAMRDFLRAIRDDGTYMRMMRRPTTFCDPDFFFSDDLGISHSFRDAVYRMARSDPDEVLLLSDDDDNVCVIDLKGRTGEVKVL